jgi:hypothetical protein
MTINRVASFGGWKRSPKYRNVREICLSDHKHRSKLEAATCNELLFRKKAGDIEDYVVEKKIPIYADPPENKIFLWNYYLDFFVSKWGKFEAVEAKGMMLGNFKKTWALLQKMHPEWDYTLVRR